MTLHRPDPALVIILAGVVAALHVGKLAPAITTLQTALGLTLVQAGFLLSLVQGAGMTLGLAFGVVADGLGGRRSVLLGLAVLALASALGGAADTVAWLMLLRAAEGFGFLLVVLPAPGLVRQLVAPARLHTMLGVWGAYMPLATALALLLGPLCIGALGWRAWWWALAALSLLMLMRVRQVVPKVVPKVMPQGPAASPAAAAQAAMPSWTARMRATLGAGGPWWLAATFAAYSAQWLAVIGFLPAMATQAGVAAGWMAPLTALVAAANIGGNLAAGRLLQRGVAPGRLLATGFLAMAAAALLAFAAAPGVPPALRYAALLGFSGFGGLVPTTLFSLALRVAPGAHTVSTTMGWMQQGSALGQFIGPPLVAWVASGAGGWQYTGLATALGALLGLACAAGLLRRLSR